MKYLIFLLLFLPCLVFAQYGAVHNLFVSGNDTVSNITTQDTIQVRLGTEVSGTRYWGPYTTLTECLNDTAYVARTYKIGETTVVFDVSNETWWTMAEYMQVRLKFNGTDLVSQSVNLLNKEGSVTIFICPDTISTNTYYTNSRAVFR